MREFQITPNIRVVAQSEPSRTGFRHRAKLYYNGSEIAEAIVSYQNRTWESYEFQTVLRRVVEKASLTPKEKAYAKKWIEGDRTDWSSFQMTGMIAGLGDLFGQTTKEKNVWKTRMLKAGLGAKGLDIPEDFGKLPDDVQAKRLNQVIGMLNKKKNKGWDLP